MQYNQVVTVTGSNFGSSRGSSTVRIGSVAIPSSSLASWTNTRIRFRVPTNVRSGNVTVRTSAGTSNAIRLGIISPYLASVSPSRVKPGDRLTLTGANFKSRRGSSYVLFAPNVRPSSSDYVTWSSSRIVVKVPARARSGNVKVVTGDGTSGTKRIVVESASPRITSVSPSQVQYDQVVTVTGSNFGSSRGSSTVRIGSIRVSSFTAWSNTRIRFRVPTNVRSGNVTVRTSAGTSNAIRLEITNPYLASVSPSRVKPGDRLTLTGANFRSTRWSGYVLFTPNVRPASSDYVSWSDSRIVVRVPAGAQSGDVKVVAIGALSSGTKRIVVESASPRITSVSPRQVQYNQVVTVTGTNFGSSRGSSTVRVGLVSIPSSALAGWSNTIIRFRVPTNVRSGNVTVRTSAGTSNAIRLEITSPYLASVSPVRVKPGDRLTLTGANFRSSRGSRRGSSYVLFAPNVWPTASSDYVTWSDSRIVVKVPAEAQSGDVRVVTVGGSSGTKRIIVEGEVVESLPSRGLFGYSPPAVTKNPKSVKFGFRATNSNLACYFSIKEISDGEVTIFLNELSYGSLNSIPTSEDWTHWYLVLDRADLRSGTNTIEFRNIINQNRTSSFARWQLKDVWVDEPPPSAKLVAGTQLLSKLSDGLVSGLGDPFPTPFNAEVTIPFVLAEASPVRISVYNLMGQQVRVLADGWLDAGAHRVRWDGRRDAGVEAASGIYWAVLHAGEIVQTAKLALIR